MQRRFIVTILGKAGSGKTDLTRYVLAACPQPHLVIDTQNEFRFGLQFRTAPELRDYIVAGRPNASGVYVLNSTTDEDSDLFFRLASTARQPSTLVVDEASLFCSPNSIDEHLNNLIQYGRHWQQNLIFNARRPAEISRHVTAQSDAIISFRQTEPRDVDTLKKSYSEAQYLPDLEEHEFLVFGDRIEELPFYPELIDRRTARGTPAWITPDTPATVGRNGREPTPSQTEEESE